MAQKHRFYVNNFEGTSDYKLFDEHIVHQCKKVLRLNTGDFMYLFNGKNPSDYKYKIELIESKSLSLKLVEAIQKNTNSSQITLYQAIPNKLSKLEYIVQKCSEVGALKIVFFQAKYSQEAKFLSEKKIERLKKIAIESAEQSNRNTVTELVIENKLDFSTLSEENLICFHTDEQESIRFKDVVLNTKTDISIFVGAEGGFHDEELEKLREQSAQFIHLGNNILRTESAGFGACFYIIQNFYN